MRCRRGMSERSDGSSGRRFKVWRGEGHLRRSAVPFSFCRFHQNCGFATLGSQNPQDVIFRKRCKPYRMTLVATLETFALALAPAAATAAGYAVTALQDCRKRAPWLRLRQPQPI